MDKKIVALCKKIALLFLVTGIQGLLTVQGSKSGGLREVIRKVAQGTASEATQEVGREVVQGARQEALHEAVPAPGQETGYEASQVARQVAGYKVVQEARQEALHEAVPAPGQEAGYEASQVARQVAGYKVVQGARQEALHEAFLEVKWNGKAYSERWNAAENWSSGTAPLAAAATDVVLDNSFVRESYSVRITEADVIELHSLVIAPDSGNTITVWIDSSSTTTLALTAGEIAIKEGGQLINASGATTGAVISVRDSLRIYDRGLYSHQTRRAHAALVSRLSRSPGTEEGIFEFNIPSASNTLSLSNQVYGTLRLSSARYGNKATYSGGAANPLTIRGNLEIGTGVNFSLNFSDTVFIHKDYIQQGGVLNLANSTRNTVLVVKGDIEQAEGQIARTGAGVPEWIVGGTRHQRINMKGSIAGNIVFKLDNPAGASLLAPLEIPYILQLKQGKLQTASGALLTIAANANLLADSTASSCFIEGPLKKTGLLNTGTFCFAVGKGVQRWLCLRNATGDFSVEYFREDPGTVSTQLKPGLDHISSVEYWSVAAEEAPAASAVVELSYSSEQSGSITDISALRVASAYDHDLWEDKGNTATTGGAGANGSVQSEAITEWRTGRLFTLASGTAMQNPLPVRLVSFEGSREGRRDHLKWRIGEGEYPDYFAIEYAADGRSFRNACTIRPVAGELLYQWADTVTGPAARYYRLRIVERHGASFYSKVVKVEGDPEPVRPYIRSVHVEGGQPVCSIQGDVSGDARIELFDMNGRRYSMQQYRLVKGAVMVRLPVFLPARGIYIIRLTDDKGRSAISRFLY